MIRPALTNYFSNIAGKRQGFAGGLNSTFTSMGNFIGPLVAGALFDVNLEFPLYMAIAVSLSGIIIIFLLKKDLSHAVKKQINTGPQQREFRREILRTETSFGDEVGHSVQDEFCVPLLCFITCNVKLMLSQI